MNALARGLLTGGLSAIGGMGAMGGMWGASGPSAEELEVKTQQDAHKELRDKYEVLTRQQTRMSDTMQPWMQKMPLNEFSSFAAQHAGLQNPDDIWNTPAEKLPSFIQPEYSRRRQQLLQAGLKGVQAPQTVMPPPGK